MASPSNYADLIEQLRLERGDLATAREMVEGGEMTVTADRGDYLQWCAKVMVALERLIGLYEEEPC
jgi:hypothetical protein